MFLFFAPSGAQGVTVSVRLCVRHKFVLSTESSIFFSQVLKYFVLLVNNGNVLLKHQVLIAPPRSFVLMNKRQDRKVLKSYIKEEEVF